MIADSTSWRLITHSIDFNISELYLPSHINLAYITCFTFTRFVGIQFGSGITETEEFYRRTDHPCLEAFSSHQCFMAPVRCVR